MKPILDKKRRIEIASLNPISIEDTLVILSEQIRRDVPFLHIRHGDGECQCMFRYFTNPNQNPENYYHETLIERLRTCTETVMQLAYSRECLCYIGSCFVTDCGPDAHNVYINHWAKTYPELTRFHWCHGDLWYYHPSVEDVETENILGLFDSIREKSKERPVVLISNETVQSARYCLGAQGITVPQKLAWNRDGEIQEEFKPYIERNALFMWASGIPGKVWMSEMFIEHPNTTHVDLGHVFDLVFGLKSRTWTTRERDGEYTRKYEDIFIPYVKSFIR